MKDILVTSSVLILALLVLRQVFRRAVSRRVQYALWGLVLARLLVPVSLPAMEHNVLTASEPARAAVSQQMDSVSLYLTPVAQGELSKSVLLPPDGSTPAVVVRDSRSETVTEHDYTVQGQSADAAITAEDGTVTWYAKALPLHTLLRCIWYAGMAVMACWLVISNLRFWRRLRKGRTPYSVEHCKYPVYLVESGLPSPCLFGLFRPAIYLTPAAVASPESLRHVLAHETTHVRHLDPLWSLLRGVCLAVYWFDPLVWIAAAASKADCELACDEGALKRLGRDERVAYGRTLLSLIPVAKRPADPLLAATTMTSDKRRLKDRITRIAENRQTVAAALFAVVAVVAVLCAVTFTGAKAPGGETGPRPLTGAELEYFNEDFFNGDDFNIRNQFLTCLYDSPEEIDLFSLFYNGAGTDENPDEEERRAVLEAGYGGYYPDTDLTKITAADMDAVLTQYTGLTLAETSQVDLDAFTYLPAYDAYYSFHGDTNARGTTTFFTGEREGDTIRLYYTDFYFGGYGPCCVTLEARPDGSYWFVSHLFSDMPAIPPALPDWEPALTVPLTDLEPYEAPAVTVERHTGNVERLLYSSGAYEDTIDIYRSTDGNTYAALEVILPSGEKAMDCFLTFPEGETFSDVAITDFYDLLGRNGVVISYYGQTGEHSYGTINDYYSVTDEGVPFLLARAYGEVCVNDLDGDGNFELAASDYESCQLFFQRDGVLYCADIETLVENAWADAQYLSFGWWDLYSRSLPLSAAVPMEGFEDTVAAFRTLYFDAENLLIYRDETPCTDHVRESVQAPEDVLEQAKRFAQNAYEARGHSADDTGAVYDDWRINELEGPWFEEAGGLNIEIWRLSYELHTTTPESLVLAGGSYLAEDNWCMIGYYGCDYLYFQIDESENRTYLYTAMENDCAPGTELFRTDMVNQLTSMGLLALEDVDGQTLLEMLWCQPVAFLDNLTENQPEAVQTAVIEKLGAYIAAGGSDVRETYASCVDHIGVFGSDLTDNARELWEALQSAVENSATMDGETALAQFTANPTAFLRSAAQWPEERQAEICRALATYYDGGPSAQQARFRDAMRSVTQEGLSGGATAVYELLRASCALPRPAARSEEDNAKIEEATRLYLLELSGSPAALVSWEIDAAETARAVSRYTASLLANGNGWTDDYTTRMVAVLGVYETGGELAARYCYLLPDAIDGSWTVWDSTSAAVPESVRADWQDRQGPETDFTKADEEFTGRALYVSADALSYTERMVWIQATAEGFNGDTSCHRYVESDGAVAFLTEQTGTPHTNQYRLFLRFSDDTLTILPLPNASEAEVAPPDSMSFSEGKFVYEVLFSEELVNSFGQFPIHLAGTYHYEVDLSAKTVSLTVLDA